jgi:hypothetical protein
MNYVQRVQPRMITAVWEQIKPQLYEAIPPMNSKADDNYAHILAALLQEKAQLWVVYNELEGGAKVRVHGYVVTIIRSDPITGDKYLHLYAMYAYHTLVPSDWDRLQDAIEAYARGNDCTELTTFTSHPVTFLHKRL